MLVHFDVTDPQLLQVLQAKEKRKLKSQSNIKATVLRNRLIFIQQTLFYVMDSDIGLYVYFVHELINSNFGFSQNRIKAHNHQLNYGLCDLTSR